MAGKQAKVLCNHHVHALLAYPQRSRYPGRNRATERCNWLTNAYLLASARLRLGSAAPQREGVGVRRATLDLDNVPRRRTSPVEKVPKHGAAHPENFLVARDIGLDSLARIKGHSQELGCYLVLIAAANGIG